MSSAVKKISAKDVTVTGSGGGDEVFTEATKNLIELRAPGDGEKPSWIQSEQQRRVSINGGVGARSKAKVSFQHKRDPKDVILEKIGDVGAETVQLSKILVAIYQPPFSEKTSGGILLTQTASEQDLEEYLWQGKVGLIVATGPQAYVDDDVTKFHGTQNKVGDWVWFRPSDGMACEVNGVFCRVFTEAGIIGKLPHPDAIW